MALTAFVGINAMAKQDVWPDGTTMDQWFANREKVDVNTLGKRYVVTDYGVTNDSTLVQPAAAMVAPETRPMARAYSGFRVAPTLTPAPT